MSNSSAKSDKPLLPPVRQRTRPAANALTKPEAEPDAEPSAAVPLAKRKPAAPPVAGCSPPDDDYEVGFGKPPKHSRFKPGPDPRRPKGRKAGSRNKTNSIVSMMESPVVIRTPQGEQRTIPTHDAIGRVLREKALSGDLRAIFKAFELYHKALPPALPDSAGHAGADAEAPAETAQTDEAILAWFEEELRASKKEPGA